MKKILLTLNLIVLLTLTFVGIARAVSIDVTCNPGAISLGESTTITVGCDKDATGSITVITPVTKISSSVSITITAGGSTSKVYPGDFSGSTSEIGEYEVIVFLSGNPFKASFWVTFEVNIIPEIPLLGTAGATATMLSSLGLYVIRRRRLK